MTSKTKLLLIPCSGEETAQLASGIYQILKEQHGLDDQVELLLGRRSGEVNKDTPKDRRHPLVADYFSDGEINVDCGSNELKDVIQGKHIALIEHLLTPNRKLYSGSLGEIDPQIISVNDHHMTVKGFLDLIKNVETLQRTLAVPYFTYMRSHSIEKYVARGFFQFNSLDLVLKEYASLGLNTLITIDPHSEQVSQSAKKFNLNFQEINPFQSGRVNPRKLGLSEEDFKGLMKHLKPFQERFVQLKKINLDHLYIVSVDDGTERRVENFTDQVFSDLSPEKFYTKIAYLSKDRISYGVSQVRFKPFSWINERNVDSEGTYILIDDMFASAKTANDVAEMLKKAGAKRVEVWTSHPVTMLIQREKANKRNYIDKVVCLDTVPQSPNLDIEYLTASANLIAAELYKVHQKLIDSR